MRDLSGFSHVKRRKTGREISRLANTNNNGLGITWGPCLPTDSSLGWPNPAACAEGTDKTHSPGIRRPGRVHSEDGLGGEC